MRYANGLWLVLFSLLTIQACSAITPPKPRTERELLAVAEIEYHEALKAAIELRKEGVVTEGMYKVLDSSFRVVSAALDTAHDAILRGDKNEFKIAMNVIRVSINEIKNIINELGGR